MEQLTNEQIEWAENLGRRWVCPQLNQFDAARFVQVFTQAKASNIADPILTRLDLIGELTSPEYISRLRGVMGGVACPVCGNRTRHLSGCTGATNHIAAGDADTSFCATPSDCQDTKKGLAATEILFGALVKISHMKYNDRSTVHEGNALGKFDKLNQEICDIFAMCDLALLEFDAEKKKSPASPVAGEVKGLAGVTLNYYDGKSLLHFEAVYPDGNQVPIFSVNKKFKAIADLIFNCVNNRADGEAKTYCVAHALSVCEICGLLPKSATGEGKG